MYVQTKKVVIIFIVMIITFGSVINTLYNETQNKIPQISVISSEELSYDISFAQSIFGLLSSEGQENDLANYYGSSIYQLSSASTTQLNNIVKSSNVVIIIGDSFNKTIDKIIAANPETQFVFVENSETFNFDNTVEIRLNYNKIYDSIDRLANEKNKFLLVLSSEYSTLSEDKFFEHKLANNINVKVEVMNKSTEINNFNKTIETDFKNGFTNVYSLSPYSNQQIEKTILEFNKSDSDTLIEPLNENNEDSDQSEETTSDESKNNDDANVEDNQDTNVVVKEFTFLNLDSNFDIASKDDLTLVPLNYNIEESVKEIVEAINEKKMLNKDITISLQ